MIKDQGVSEAFRAQGLFPDKCPTSTVGEWVEQNAKQYNFTTNGSPGWYPTRTLEEEWEKARALWEPYVFRGPSLHQEAEEAQGETAEEGWGLNPSPIFSELQSCRNLI